MDIELVTVLWTVAGTIISALVTRSKSKVEYKFKIKEIENDYDFKIKSLENSLNIKDKDIESMRIKHELDLKSKEADAMNPFIAQWIQNYMEDPEGVTKKLETVQDNMSRINRFQGHKKKSK